VSESEVPETPPDPSQSAPPPSQAPAAQQPVPSAEIKDDNQLRGAEFKKIMRKPLTWILIVVLAVVIGGAIAAAGFAFFGGIAFLATFLLGILVCFFMADSRAENAFFDAYAKSRGLTRGGSLPGTTNLLRQGDERQTDQFMFGQLSNDCAGAIALYTYTEVSTDSDGNRQETDYPFTVLYAEMPETLKYTQELRVERKSGFKALEGFEDKFRSSERVTLESEAMRDRYEIFVGKEQDPVWVRRFFSPSFIVWLTDAPPKHFFFELQGGSLCCAIPKHRKSADALDEMRDVSLKVVARINEELTESR